MEAPQPMSEGQTTAAAHLSGYIAAVMEACYLEGTAKLCVLDPWTTQLDLPGGHRLTVTVEEEEGS
jgi:hypothetical protein